MAIKMLFFDYRKAEYNFFKTHKFDNYDIKFYDFSLNQDSLELIPQEDKDSAVVISVFINSFLTAEVINSFKNLRIISTRSTDYDNINNKACRLRNINVVNVPNYGSTAISEYTFGLMISLLRKIAYADNSVRRGDFAQKDFIGNDLNGLVLGVVGTGSTGYAVCKLANAFEMKVLGYDLQQKKELCDSVEYTDFENLLKNSDIITLHLPFTGNNYHMFSKYEFELMKKGAYFINVSRGELVDNLYLKEGLQTGRIAGAALDVLACREVCKNCKIFSDQLEVSSLSCFEDSEVIKELIKMPNVIITPHIAYESKGAVDYILKTTFDGIMECVNGGLKNRVI